MGGVQEKLPETSGLSPRGADGRQEFILGQPK